ncbi:MAG: rRNA maturation RNase YbeY [Clostridia bacterium]|nr:rRNA maturation RNase YbeY [Clostridia bacterium]
MFLYFDEDFLVPEGIKEYMNKSAVLCAKEEGLDAGRLSVSVSFVGKDEIQDLNREYRGKDRVTDVLSFPQFEGLAYFPSEGEINLGDVVICSEVAENQAIEYGHSLEREMLYLFTHSMFHLFGYDHIREEGKREMREKEERVMTELLLPANENGGNHLGL